MVKFVITLIILFSTKKLKVFGVYGIKYKFAAASAAETTYIFTAVTTNGS